MCFWKPYFGGWTSIVDSQAVALDGWTHLSAGSRTILVGSISIADSFSTKLGGFHKWIYPIWWWKTRVFPPSTDETSIVHTCFHDATTAPKKEPLFYVLLVLEKPVMCPLGSWCPARAESFCWAHGLSKFQHLHGPQMLHVWWEMVV